MSDFVEQKLKMIDGLRKLLKNDLRKIFPNDLTVVLIAFLYLFQIEIIAGLSR